MILVDTSGVLAWLDGSQREHGNVARTMSEVEGPFLLSPFVLAELDYLLATRVSRTVQDLLLGEVERGALRLEPFTAADVGAARQVMKRFGDLDLGLADASVVVLADRHRVTRVLTLDARHFRALRRTDGTPFELIPESARDAQASVRRRRR